MEFAAFYDYLTTANGNGRPTLQCYSIIERPVHILMESVAGQNQASIWVKDNQVCVIANGNVPLVYQTCQARRRRTAGGDPLICRHASGPYAKSVDGREAHFDRGHAPRDLAKVVQPGSLIGGDERTVIGAYHLQLPIAQGFP
jgi:hypothetical protein